MADILLVEDNQELAELIQTFLSKEGWTCYPVINGEDALSWLFNHLPKVILLDIMLPGMDGFAFCQILLIDYPQAMAYDVIEEIQ